MTSPVRHSLLRRQIRRYFDEGDLPPVPDAFLEAVDEAYQQFDDDRLMLERSLDLSSEELFAANWELRALFHALPDLVLRLDADGTVRDIKAGYDRDIYRDVEFLTGKRFQDAPFQSDPGDIEAVIREVLEGGEMRSLSYTLGMQGEEKSYEARLMPFLGKQVLAVVRDITDRERALADLREAKALLEMRVAERTLGLRKANEALRQEITDRKEAEERRRQLEAKLLQAQKLESLGVLAGGIAHDFNNLLMAIIGNASLAGESLPSGHPVRKHIEEIEAASHRASGLTEQMLAYSGKRRFAVERIDVSGIAASMAGLLDMSVSKKTNLVCDLASNLPLVEADPAQISQIVMNLITNASEAVGSGGGTVTLRTGAMEADAGYLRECLLGERVDEGSFVFIEVSDDGEGMDERTLAKIFDPFLTTKFTGRGLGLAAVLGIVNGHHGAIRVVSAPGKGSCFTVLLPTVDRHHGSRLQRSEDGSVQKGTVLVIDDDVAIRKLIGSAVEDAGYRVVSAGDGRSGVGVFRLHVDEIDCIVLDMTMPVMGGRQAFEEIRDISATVPVILMSGYSPGDAARSFSDRSYLAFLQKPFPPRELLGLIDELGEKQSAVPSPEDGNSAVR